MPAQLHSPPHPRHRRIRRRQPQKISRKKYPCSTNSRIHGAKLRLASVVSNAKLARSAPNRFTRSSKIAPASSAAAPGRNPDNPRAITSAFTNVSTEDCRRRLLASLAHPHQFDSRLSILRVQ
jgi:hypothetical protein